MTRDMVDDPLLLHALADGELDVVTALALEKRIASEPELAAEYERILALRARVARLDRPAVSQAFAARIAALAPLGGTLSQTQAASRNAAARPSWRADWRQMAAALVATACLASGITYGLTMREAFDPIEAAVVGGHRRSLLAASPIDIASSDRHTVRPWLDAKLGVSPPTPDLVRFGFSLVGARVDVVVDRPVPSIVYRHNEHLITVVALPVQPGRDVAQSPTRRPAGGYNVISWSEPGFRYWAISDLDMGELGVFVDALRSH